MRFYIEITGYIKKSSKFQNFILVLGVRKIDFYDFSGIFLRKNGLEYGITSETTETRDPRVRRRKPGISIETAGPGISSETAGLNQTLPCPSGVTL